MPSGTDFSANWHSGKLSPPLGKPRFASLSPLRLAQVHAPAMCSASGACLDENDLYENLTWLASTRSRSSAGLFAARRSPAQAGVISSTTSPAAIWKVRTMPWAPTYNRDGKKGKKQSHRLLCDETRPVSTEVFRAYPRSADFGAQVRKASQPLGVSG